MPTGSVSRIASELSIEEQTVRNYFGAKKYQNGQVVGCHIEPGPEGGIVHLDDDKIMIIAKRIIAEAQNIGV